MAPRAQGGKGRTPRREFTERGDGGGRRHGLCRFFQQTGHCKFGSKCKFPHDPSSTLNSEEPSRQFLERKEETPEQILAKAKYISWKRLIKIPPKQNDIATIRLLWTGALTILNGDDRDWKQMLPRDLDDQHNYGREHIQTLLSMVARSHGSGTFIDLAQPFLLVITHSALLDCLSVDTFVGTLYNFISGSNGTRAIPFFQRLSKCLLDIHVETSVTRSIANFETMLVAISTALWELLKRERRVTFHDDLPDLLNSLEKITKICSIDKQSAPFQLVANRIGELRAMIAHANHLLSHEEKPQGDGVSTVVTSVYPRDIVLPQDRYDNDKMDISKIKILPTEDEIRSNHAEFLPSTEPDQPHFLTDKAQRHFDTQFRLLRHDIFGELKEALGGLMTSVENNPTLLDNVKLGLGNIRAYPYPKAHIRYISFDKRRGLEAQISFAQPFLLRKKQPPERRRWWEESKRLEEGVLLCFVSLINLKSSLLFFVASERCVDTKKQHSLSSHDYLGTITAKLATRTQSDMELMIRLSGNDTGGVLLEFPGVLLASFIPILENLQQMQQLSRLPFRQWILPDPITLHGNASKLLDIPPPLYARDPCFTFSLKSILKNPNTDFSLRSSALVKDNSTINKLEAQTELDRGQCEALIAALTREFAFIQGPPGTGKSYLGVQLMKVLLACKSKAHLGPIVVVCYTNHALDQFLEHLSKIGIEKIIRIGGQSQSTILERKNLRIVSQGEMKTKSERYLLATAYSALESERRRIESTLHLLNSIGKRPEWTNLKIHLNQKYPRIHSQFSLVDEDGFQIVGKEPFEDWSQWLRGEFLGESDKSDKTEPTPKEIEHILKVANQNVHSLSLSDRARLIEFWTKEIREDSTDELFELVERDDTLRQKLTNIHDDVDRRVLQTADVIGVTTTGLARRISTLQHVACKVVICEEAGEVMEPHMISALLPSVQHLIQIGDHQQLRPKINNYGLSLESQQGTPYQLDRSQFERLSVGGRGRPTVPVAQLNVQRRMRPEISTLVRETIYPRLVDHTSTKNLPNVVGMRKNVFWFDHDNTEEGPQVDVHQKSHSNVWEVEMTYALVRHIVHQGAYSSSEIAVLTPYTGQLQKLRAVMRNDFEIVLSERDQEMLAKDGFGVEDNDPESEQRTNQLDSEKKPLEKKKLSELLRVATVDNFQGEEAKIVIMSLVRSNKEKKVGFLRTTNRINVLLSRAQHGMYLIGNIETYSNIPMWAKVLGRLQMTDSVGEAFDLCCPRHPDIEMKVYQPDDFARLSPEGGCQLPCDRRLASCGHRCQARCHSESMHQIFPCPQPCQRLHSPCNHSCQKQTCGEDCGLCLVKLNDVQLPCGHSKDNVSCYQTQDLDKIYCKALTQRLVPRCKHTVKVSCSQDVESPTFNCPTPCETILECGHLCQGTCSRCSQKDANDQYTVKHVLCKRVCDRRFGTCNHTCKRPCHNGKDCGPCPSSCEVRCAHSRCTLKCHEACAPCVESCTWSCEHKGDCNMPCAAPCNRLPCNRRCSKKLSCGHQCPGICGEICPEGYCQMCSDQKDARVDLLEMKSYSEIDLDDTPIVVLGCGHFFTAETLDGHVGMTEVYTTDRCGEFVGLQDISAVLAWSIPRCPDCQCPVRQYATQRYNRVINRAVIDEMSKRFLVNGQIGLHQLEQQIEELEQILEDSRAKITRSNQQALAHFTKDPTHAKTLEISKQLAERHNKSKKLKKDIESFCNKVADKHQPAQKLHDATVHASRKISIDGLMADLNVSASVPVAACDRQITFGGRIAQIKIEYIILSDKFNISQTLRSTPAGSSIKIPGGDPDQLVKPFLQTSKTLFEDCNSEKLPKFAVEVSVYYARIARLFESYCRSTHKNVDKAQGHVEVAKGLLDEARQLCVMKFQNVEVLRKAVEDSMQAFRKEWYEEVTAEELTSVKNAMVGGPQGIATRSGHWYNCENGHPFAIGECGMPMELARCPECGAPVGGRNHSAVAGVTRATNMEA